MDNNILVQFHGMKHTQSEQLEDWLESLMRHSPNESICRLHVFKDPHGYLCKLTVYSRVRTFSSQFKDADLNHSIKNVLTHVKQQVAKWKKNRSSMELTGLIPIRDLDLQNLENQNNKINESYESDHLNDREQDSVFLKKAA